MISRMRLTAPMAAAQKDRLWTNSPEDWAAITSGAHVLGIDGCPGGWVIAARPVPDRFANTPAIGLAIAPSFAHIINHRETHKTTLHSVMVDMPIGLRDEGRRACESEARKRIGPRRSSVFSAPRRPMLGHETYQDANQWGKDQGTSAGGGLSKQAWNILPKIREIDDAISACDQNWLGEAHPEVTFTRLNNNAPCEHAKKKTEGSVERMRILSAHGIIGLDSLFADFKKTCPYRYAPDDLVDAIAMTLTAQGRLDATAWCLGDQTRDARGLLMQIWA